MIYNVEVIWIGIIVEVDGSSSIVDNCLLMFMPIQARSANFGATGMHRMV